MADNFVREITPMEEDFAQWYTDVIRKTDLIDYSDVKGFFVLRPYGYALWEKIQSYLDRRFKETGHQNLYFPLLIPESLLNKEKDHVEGFAPEVAWVTHGGDRKLNERLCIRPTSETIICSMYSKWLTSYRQLPFLYNQWANVLRWEKETRPFLRHREFLWQEGHTLHETPEEAMEETLKILNIYIDLAEKVMALPLVVGKKSEKEKFAGAVATYTIEAMMKDGKALQAGTSHFLGQHFTKAFDIKYQGRDAQQEYPYHTSWGVSTRLIGALIMAHGDNRGLVLPPAIAPIEVAIVAIAGKNPEVMEEAIKIKSSLVNAGLTVELDEENLYSGGWYFNEYEMKGIPIRIDIGPRDLKKGVASVVRRDTLTKVEVPLEELVDYVKSQLQVMQEEMLVAARKMMTDKIYQVETLEEIYEAVNEKEGFAHFPWCLDVACEDRLKEEEAITIRCIDEEDAKGHCAICGKDAHVTVFAGKAY